MDFHQLSLFVPNFLEETKSVLFFIGFFETPFCPSVTARLVQILKCSKHQR